MTRHFSEDRRLILRLAASTAIIAATPAIWAGPARAGAGCGPDLASRLAALIPHADSAARIGSRYLASAPAEADAGLLVSSILGPQAHEATADAVLRRVVGESRQRDFLDGNTVSVDGWILSGTEARLCALVALQAA
jgi:hypothetical protein